MRQDTEVVHDELPVSQINATVGLADRCGFHGQSLRFRLLRLQGQSSDEEVSIGLSWFYACVVALQ